MRVVVSVQAKRASSRGLVHYVAHSKIDATRGEPKTREIFNSYADSLSVEKANLFLKSGTSLKRPANDELHHLVISLKSEDYDRLGGDEKERQESLKKITRHAVSKLKESLSADRLNWAAGIHRNTDNPHVHIALQKEFFDKNFEKKTLTKIPNDCLPHYQKSADEKNFAPGVLIEAATEKLDELILEKARKQSKQNSSQQRNQNFHDGNHQKAEPNKTKSAIEPGEKLNAGVKHRRDVLARAILAKFYLEKSQETLDSLETNGHLRRFKITDAVTGRKRQMSLFDLERRAEKSAARELRKMNVSDAGIKDAITKKLVALELEKNADSIKRIRAILHNLIVKENQNLASRESDYKKVKPAAEQIRRACARENRKLPIPNLTAAEVEMLQNRSIEKRDVRLANYFENVRRGLAARERGTPTRNDEEIRRLKALRTVSALKVASREKQLKDSVARKRFMPVEIGGEKWSLEKADALIEKRQAEEQKLVGKIGKVLSKIGLVEENQTRAKLEEIKTQVAEKLSEKNEQSTTQLQSEKNILKMLDEFYKNDTHAEKETLKPKFTASELAEVEALAFELKNVRVYGENWRHQKEFIENAGALKTGESDKDLKKKTIAGRAVAREIMCDAETARAKEELSLFQKNKIFQKFEVTDAKNGAARFVSLKEVELNARGSILDQTLEFFAETSEKRRMRHALEKLVKEKESDLKENLKSARELLKVAGAETAPYKQKSFFGAVRYSVAPVFTPKELLTLEIRIKQTENKTEAKNLQKILGLADYEEAKNLSAILVSFDTGKENFKTAEQSPPIEREPEPQFGKNEQTKNEIAQADNEKTIEAKQPERVENDKRQSLDFYERGR